MLQFVFWEASWINWKRITGFPKLRSMDAYFDENVPRSNLDEKLLTNTFLLCLFGFQHSFMARKYFKEVIMPVSERLTRSLYIYATAQALDALVNNWEPIPELIYDVSQSHPGLFFLITLIHFSTLGIIGISIFSIDGWHFLGYKQAVQMESNNSFQVNWFYKIVRHPIYFSLLVQLWSTPALTYGRLLYATFLSFYTILACLYLEEPDLIEEIGEEYKVYTNRVPSLCPFKSFKICYCARKCEKLK